MAEEKSDINSRRIFVAGASLALLLVLIGILLLFLQNYFSGGKYKNEKVSKQVIYPNTQTEFESGKLADAQKKRQLLVLDSFAWIDEQNGRARVPIEMAMKAVIKAKTFDSKKLGLITPKGRSQP